MNNTKEPTRFLWSRTYILEKKGKPVRFFNVKKRVGDMLFFELCEKDNRQQLVGRIFIPEGENREVCGFDWNGEFVLLLPITISPVVTKGVTLKITSLRFLSEMNGWTIPNTKKP